MPQHQPENFVYIKARPYFTLLMKRVAFRQYKASLFPHGYQNDVSLFVSCPSVFMDVNLAQCLEFCLPHSCHNPARFHSQVLILLILKMNDATLAQWKQFCFSCLFSYEWIITPVLGFSPSVFFFYSKFILIFFFTCNQQSDHFPPALLLLHLAVSVHPLHMYSSV